MEKSLSQQLLNLLAYDPNTRGLKKKALFGYGLGEKNFESFIVGLVPLVSQLLKTTENSVTNEFGELIRYRAIFLLLPCECLFENPSEDKPVIRRHLTALGVPVDEDIVRAIKFLCENFRNQRLGNVKKFSITDVYIKSPGIYGNLMRSQSGRCCICGEYIVYGQNMHLDHIVPWHLGDDPVDGSNWQLLCVSCNRGKGVYPYYSMQQTGFNWIRPAANNTLTEQVRYASLVRDGGCKLTGKKASMTRLIVVKKVPSGCWVFDNTMTIAESEFTKLGSI